MIVVDSLVLVLILVFVLVPMFSILDLRHIFCSFVLRLRNLFRFSGGNAAFILKGTVLL